MKISKIVYTEGFKKKLQAFSKKEEKKILKKVCLFWEDPFHSSLKTHKLSGKLKNYWSFSLTYQTRIIFRFRSEETVEFIDIGGHEIYK